MLRSWFTGWNDLDRQVAMMEELRRQLDAAFDGQQAAGAVRQRSAVFPRMNLFDRGDSYLLQAELPGVSGENLELQGNLQSLTLSGTRALQLPEGYSVHRQERSQRRFSRSVSFPVKVDVAGTSASLKDGLLQVTVPKLPESQPRSIEVTLG